MIWAVISTLCTGLFAGAAVYVNAVEHPARLQCGIPIAVQEFGPSYHRGAVMQASLAILGLLSAIVAWIQLQDALILIAGLLVGAVVPFTLIVILPTNKQLLDPALDRNSPRAAALLLKWGKLHAIRSVLSVIAFLILLMRIA